MSNITKAVAALSVVAGLGVAALPLSSFAATSQVDITAIVDNTIGISVSAPEVEMTVAPNGPVSTKTVDVTVTTNNTRGYTLNIKDSDNETALVRYNDSLVAEGTILQLHQLRALVAGASWAVIFLVLGMQSRLRINSLLRKHLRH